MSNLEALILGLLQGLTEFLPISSSAHIELATELLGAEIEDPITFQVVVHAATVLSTIVVFNKELWGILRESLKFKWNEETQYIVKIFISMIPVALVYVTLKNPIEAFFEGRVSLIGWMFLITAAILFSTTLVRSNHKPVGFLHSFLIGVAQAIAIIPGISRSGATICAGLLLGVDKASATRFAFLMILIPTLGIFVLKGYEAFTSPEIADTNFSPLLVGFIAAFISGLISCKWMITIVRSSKIAYFAIYCLFIGIVSIIAGYLMS